MQSLVTVATKSNAVVNDEAQIRKSGIRLDVVCLEVSALIIAAMLTGVSIACIDSIAPLLVLSTAPIFPITLTLSMTIGIMLLAARCAFTCDLANLAPRFLSVTFPRAVTDALFSRLAHFLASVDRVLLSFERRGATFGKFALWYPDARLALCA
jgi:hypothetical protein